LFSGAIPKTCLFKDLILTLYNILLAEEIVPEEQLPAVPIISEAQPDTFKTVPEKTIPEVKITLERRSKLIF
jgi:hypothetical protein